MIQVFAAVAVSTGCLSFGICMAYISSGLPSMMESSSAIKISQSEASWMSEYSLTFSYHKIMFSNCPSPRLLLHILTNQHKLSLHSLH